MRRMVLLLPSRSELNLQTPPVLGMRNTLDELLGLELVDDTRHRAELNVKFSGKLAHHLRAMKVEAPQAVGLRDGEHAVEWFFLAPELVESCEFV